SVGTYSTINVLAAIYKEPIPNADRKRNSANCSKFWVKPSAAVNVEKIRMEMTTVRTRPKWSQAQPPINPPMAIPAKVKLPSAPACKLLKPNSDLRLFKLNDSNNMSAPSTSKARKANIKATWWVLLVVWLIFPDSVERSVSVNNLLIAYFVVMFEVPSCT